MAALLLALLPLSALAPLDPLLVVLAGLVIVLVLAAGLLSTSWSIAIICFVVFTRLAATLGSDRIGYAALALALGAACLVSQPNRGREDRLVPFALAALLFLSLTMMSALWAQRPELVREESVVTAAQVAVSLGAIACLRDLRDLRWASWALALSGLLVGVIALRQYVLQDYTDDVFGLARSSVAQIVGDDAEYRAGGPVGDANFFGQVMCVVVSLAAALVVGSRRRRAQALAAVVVLVAGATVVITYSRGALVALLIAGLLVLVRLRRVWTVLACVGVVSIVGAVALPPSYLDRVAEIGRAATVLASSRESIDEPAIRGRTSSWVVAGEIFADHPLTGVGAGNYKGRYLEYSAAVGLDQRGEARSAHSLPLQVLAEQGLVGGAAFGVLVVGGFVSLRRARRALSAAGGARTDVMVLVGLRDALVVYLVASAFLHSAYPQLLFLLLALCWASPACVRPRGSGTPNPEVLPQPGPVPNQRPRVDVLASS